MLNENMIWQIQGPTCDPSFAQSGDMVRPCLCPWGGPRPRGQPAGTTWWYNGLRLAGPTTLSQEGGVGRGSRSWASRKARVRGGLQARSRQPRGVQTEAVAGEAGQVCRRPVGMWEAGTWHLLGGWWGSLLATGCWTQKHTLPSHLGGEPHLEAAESHIHLAAALVGAVEHLEQAVGVHHP